MRLFVAVDVSERVRRHVSELVSAMAARPVFRRAAIAWVPADRLHLTIQFIGHVSDDVADDVRHRLSPAYPLAPFPLVLDGLGAFPPTGRLRVIWIGLRRGTDGLLRVYDETRRRLEGVPFRREARPFAPHLTIGRLREPAPATLRRELDAVEARTPGRCTIDAVTLYESRLSPRGATYIPVLRAPLEA